MALRNQAFKVIGMWRDNSESSQDNKYAYENFNMRIEARDGNTQLSMENERGNELIEIVGEKIDPSYSDAAASISNGLLEIKGTPIGYCQIGDDILLFTTETERMSDEELQEYNEDPTYVTNKRNIFTLSSAKIYSISISDSTTLKLYLSLLETSDWINFLDDLEIKIIFSTLKHTNTQRDQYEISNYSSIGRKTAEPIANGVLYDFIINSELDGDYIFIHSLEIRYNNDLAAIIDIRKLYGFNDYKYEMMNSIVVFPSYTNEQVDFTTGFTTVGSYDNQSYNASVINGTSSQSGNVISFSPNENYTDTIKQVFTQNFDNDELLGLVSGGTVAEVNNTSIEIPINSKHTDVVVLKCSDDTEDPSLIDVTSISCDPVLSWVPQQGTFNVTVNHEPARALCTAICNFPEEYIQLVGRNGNTFTFKLLSIGESESQFIEFSCQENPLLSATSQVKLGETRLVDTPLTHTFPADGSDEFTIKIFSSEYRASDFSAYVDDVPLVMDQEESIGDLFIYAVEDFTDTGGDVYNIELTVYAYPNLTDSDRHSILNIYLPGHIYFTQIGLLQEHNEPQPEPPEPGDDTPGNIDSGGNGGNTGNGGDSGGIDTEEPAPGENQNG